MSSDLLTSAYGVLLPVTNEIQPNDALLAFLDHGGKAILFGEYPDEYASGQMRPSRIVAETGEAWLSCVENLRSRSGDLLIAADGDISAVNRMHVLAPPLPTLTRAQQMPILELEDIIAEYGVAVSRLGVNMLLSPTADVIAGRNDWLRGRVLGEEVDTVDRLVGAYVRGAKRAGIQTALKHFPGNPTLTGIPALEAAMVLEDLASLRILMKPFWTGMDAGAEGMMMSPAIFGALTPPVAGSISPTLIGLLRDELGFRGLVMTCDLDHKATQRNATIEETCLQALLAGADLLLLSASAALSIPSIVLAIVTAVDSGRLPKERLEAAARSTRAAAARGRS
ncbi:glycoside hydrolase [Mesorhizobium sp. B2-4-15]|nr:glycoside hydrolase [Mesorhizobium sp. B2-4-15]